MPNSSDITVSVVTPCFNGDKYIVESIESVLNQADTDVEIVIVDDGSTDTTKQIIIEYFHNKNVRYIYQENKGPSAARNRGIRESRGKYIAFLDADDVLLDGSIAKRKSILEKNKDVYFVFSDFLMEDRVGSNYQYYKKHIDLVSLLSSSVKNMHNDEYIFNENYFKNAFVNSIFPWTGTVMVRKECFDMVGLFNEGLKICEDGDMFMRIASKFRVAYIDIPLSIYKNYRSLVTKDTEKYFSEIISYLDNQLLNADFVINDSDMYSATKQRLSRYLFSLGYYYFLNNKKKKARKCFLSSIRNNRTNYKSYYSILATFFPEILINFKKALK